MQQVQSLKKNREFRVVYARGKSVANRWLVLYVYPGAQAENRLGIAVGKKVGKSVMRSRIKRLIKESYRLLAPQVHTGFDLVIVARPSSGTLQKQDAFREISRALRGVLKKQNLWREDAAP